MINIYSVAQAAVVLNVSTTRVYQLITAGKLKAYRPGGDGHFRIRKDDLETYLFHSPATGRIKQPAEPSSERRPPGLGPYRAVS